MKIRSFDASPERLVLKIGASGIDDVQIEYDSVEAPWYFESAHCGTGLFHNNVRITFSSGFEIEIEVVLARTPAMSPLNSSETRLRLRGITAQSIITVADVLLRGLDTSRPTVELSILPGG